MVRSNELLSTLRVGVGLLLLSASLLACKEGGSGTVRGEDTPCTDQSDCAPFHLVCAAPPGAEEGQATRGLCVRSIPPGSCAYYVREGQASGRFCAD